MKLLWARFGSELYAPGFGDVHRLTHWYLCQTVPKFYIGESVLFFRTVLIDSHRSFPVQFRVQFRKLLM